MLAFTIINNSIFSYSMYAHYGYLSYVNLKILQMKINIKKPLRCKIYKNL